MSILTNDSKGFTLVEVMVAILIMIVGLLGLLQAINVAMEYNLKNNLRDEAVFLGEKHLNELKSQGFDNIAATSPAITTFSKRSAGTIFTIEMSSDVLSRDELNNPTTKQLNVTVRWTYKGASHVNRLSIPVAKPS